jgi:hypothetical protein
VQDPQTVPRDNEQARIVTRTGPLAHTVLQRPVSASTLDSMHSMDHGTLDTGSGSMQHHVDAEGPWMVYDGLPGPPACPQGRYLAHAEPIYQSRRRAAPEVANPFASPALQQVCFGFMICRC